MIKTRPIVGDKVKLKGRTPIGILKNISEDKYSNWCDVDWEIDGPKICHLLELETVK